jgi:hypothetical protein
VTIQKTSQISNFQSSGEGDQREALEKQEKSQVILFEIPFNHGFSFSSTFSTK